MRYFLCCISLLISFDALPQQWLLPLNRDLYNRLEIHKSDSLHQNHTTLKPLIINQTTYDSLFNISPFPTGRNNFLTRFADNFLNQNLLIIDTGEFYLTINPVFNFTSGFEPEHNRRIWTNTRGFWLNGAIGKKMTFHSSFFENQAIFPGYLDRQIRRTRVVPGQGHIRRFKGTGFDYNMASGYVSYSPNKIFNIQFGHDKIFIGDGYRSLLLSDNSFNYPFLKITTSIHRFQYTNLFTQFQNLSTGSVLGIGHQKKYGAFHFLSTNIGKRLNLGLFESVIFQDRGFDVNYLNPIIFLRPVEYSLGSPDRVLLGMTGKYKFTTNILSYGQFSLDDFMFREFKKRNGFYQQKYGIQIGLQFLNVFLPWHNLRIEYNQVRPYVYGHKLPAQNYAHYNQALAHPMGANFRELILNDNIYYKRWVLSSHLILSRYGADTANSHFGKNIFRSDYDIPDFPNSFGNYTGQGIKTDLIFLNFQLGYLINPKNNMKAFINYTYRFNHSLLMLERTNIFSIGIITDLRNHYYDF